MFGTEFPIFAFSHCRDVVAAVSRAGGLGVLGAVAYGPEDLAVAMTWLDDHVGDRPYGVDVIVPAKYVGDRVGGLRSGEVRALIPEEHEAFVRDLLERYGVPDLPDPEFRGGPERGDQRRGPPADQLLRRAGRRPDEHGQAGGASGHRHGRGIHRGRVPPSREPQVLNHLGDARPGSCQPPRTAAPRSSAVTVADHIS
jgi:Nitronate monooxygenase